MTRKVLHEVSWACWVFFISCPASFAAGLGSQSWNAPDYDAGGPSGMPAWSEFLFVGSFVFCYWLVFSEKSPLHHSKVNGFVTMFLIFFAPFLLALMVVSMLGGV